MDELATFKKEVQFDSKDMFRNIIYSSHGCMRHILFFRQKDQGIEPDPAQ